jgi:REP element-mobilizing transposase RayT
MACFKNRYRVESARLPGWDYRTPAHYFVTVCTKNHALCLARIINAESYLSPLGLIVAEEIWRTPYRRPNVEIDCYVVMPNHFHAVVDITGSQSEEPMDETSGALSSAGSLGTVVGAIKSAATRRIHDAGYGDFAWQPRFHDHIIRSDEELQRIRAYVQGNPGRWYEDRYYVGGS